MPPQPARARVGLGLRPELWPWLLEHAEALDVVEVMVDDLLHLPPKRARDSLAPLRQAGVGLVVHGVGLSVASADGPNKDYLRRVARVLDALEVTTFSEHCSFHRCGDMSVGQFMPVPFTEGWAELIATNVKAVQKLLGRTMLLENISYLTARPDEGLGEPEFLRQVSERAQCGLLLDLENVRVNAFNHGYDPAAYLAALPLERVGQVHLAGGHVNAQGVRVDSHSDASSPEVLAWLSAIAAMVSQEVTIIVERDKSFPAEWSPLGAELHIIRHHLATPDTTALAHAGPFPSGAPCSTEHLSPQAVQRSWLSHFRHAGELSTAPLEPHITAIPERFRSTFAHILDGKRRDKLAAMLPGTWAALKRLGKREKAMAHWYSAQDRQDLSAVAEAQGFALAIQGLVELPEALGALADHESTVAALRAAPLERWRPRWLPQRQHRRSRFAPESLDAVAQTGVLPEPLARVVDVTYTRHPGGVWVSSN